MNLFLIVSMWWPCSCFHCVRYFIATNATSTFRSILSDYPGELVLVSIQVAPHLCIMTCYFISREKTLNLLVELAKIEVQNVDFQ